MGKHTKAYRKFVELYCPKDLGCDLDLVGYMNVCEQYNCIIQEFLEHGEITIDTRFYEENKRFIEDFFFRDTGYVIIDGICISEISQMGYGEWVSNCEIARGVWHHFPRPNICQTLVDLIPKLPKIYRNNGKYCDSDDYQLFEAFEVPFARISNKNEAEQIITTIHAIEMYSWDSIKYYMKESLFRIAIMFFPFSRKMSYLVSKHYDQLMSSEYFLRVKAGEIPLFGCATDDSSWFHKYIIKEMWLMVEFLSRNLRLPNGYYEKRLVYDIIGIIIRQH